MAQGGWSRRDLWRHLTGALEAMTIRSVIALALLRRRQGREREVVNWDFELASANGLMRRGWTRSSLKAGDVVTVAYGAKDAPYLSNASSITMSDGCKMFAGSSFENAQGQ
jgi:hypothetical protein